jgi:hypothetical protein
MEDTNQPLDTGLGAAPPSREQLHFSDAVRTDLLESAKWTLFFAILLFILLGVIAVISLFAMMAGGAAGMIGGIMALGIYGALIFFPGWYYYKFSTLTRQALAFEDNDALDEGFAHLKRFYRFIGILMIVLVSFYLLFAIVGLSILGSRL